MQIFIKKKYYKINLYFCYKINLILYVIYLK